MACWRSWCKPKWLTGRPSCYQYQLRLARFPMPRDLDSFNFRESAVNKTQICQLHTGEYLTRRTTSCCRRNRHRQDAAGRCPIKRSWPASAPTSTASWIWSIGKLYEGVSLISVIGDAKMTTARLDRLTHRCDIPRPGVRRDRRSQRFLCARFFPNDQLRDEGRNFLPNASTIDSISKRVPAIH